MFSERSRPTRQIEKSKKPEKELSPKARLALLLSFLVGSAAIVHEALDQHKNPSAPTHLEHKKKKELEIDLGMIGRLLRGLKESGTLEDDTAAEEEIRRTSDFRDVHFNQEAFRNFPHKDEPDSPFTPGMIRINMDRKYAEFLDENSDANDEFNQQIENLRFDVDENAAHLYIEGEAGTDQVYTFERVEGEESGEFFGWFLKASDDQYMNLQILVSDSEEGFDPAAVEEAVRKHYQDFLLEDKAKDFPYEVMFE